MYVFIQNLISGIALGSLYALVAIGYSLVYGVLELINMTHGTIYMVGAYLFYIAHVLWGVPMILALLFSMVICGILGFSIERFTLRPLRKRGLPKFTALICTIGVSTVLQNVMLFLMGSLNRSYPAPFYGKSFKIGEAYLTYLQLFVTVVAALLLIVFNLFFTRSKLGTAMRATAQNSDAAELMGISTDLIIGLTFLVGAVFAAISGVFGCMVFMNVSIVSGNSIGMKTFAATVLGGIGEFKGAVLGGILIGVVECMTAGYIGSEVRDIAAFLILIIILLFRPSGLLGKPVLKKV